MNPQRFLRQQRIADQHWKTIPANPSAPDTIDSAVSDIINYLGDTHAYNEQAIRQAIDSHPVIIIDTATGELYELKNAPYLFTLKLPDSSLVNARTVNKNIV
jgi:hypothetical protein